MVTAAFAEPTIRLAAQVARIEFFILVVSKRANLPPPLVKENLSPTGKFIRERKIETTKSTKKHETPMVCG
jgi:hypothetical protein